MDDPKSTPNFSYDIEDEYRPEPVPPPAAPAWQDGSFRIGIHTSIAGDIAGALDTARKLGASALQIFSASPRMWPRGGTRIVDADAARFRARRAELSLGPVVIHANYLINLASPDRVMRARSIQAFHDEIVRGVALGADFLVVHPGAALGAEKSQAIADIADGLRQAARVVKFAGLRVLLENTSGMGSSVGSRFEELRQILDGVPDLPAGVCIDTAHTFEAGYDISTAQGLEETLAVIDRTVGLARIYVLHVNDSKTPMGSRVDRHENIGQGKMGLDAFRRILNHPRLGPGPEGLAGRAFILETPIEAPGDDRRNVRTLWELLGVSADKAPKAEEGFSMTRVAKSPITRKVVGKDKKAGALKAHAEKVSSAGKKKHVAAKLGKNRGKK